MLTCLYAVRAVGKTVLYLQKCKNPFLETNNKRHLHLVEMLIQQTNLFKTDWLCSSAEEIKFYFKMEDRRP